MMPVGQLGFETPNRRVPPGTNPGEWRSLTSEEIAELEVRRNRADDWANLRVREGFSVERVNDCRFYGDVFIGSLSASLLEYHDLRLPVGLDSSTIVSCEIGDDVVIRNVSYMARTAVKDRCILFNINEIITTDHAKFGNGVVMDGEEEDVRIWLEIANENGGRKVQPFDGMLPADAWMWSRYRTDRKLLTRFEEMTAKVRPPRRGDYGVVGRGSVIKDCRIIKDVKIGPAAYIKGCNKLKNLTINSDDGRPTQLGEGCELVNGIIGYGCRVFYGVKAVRFILNDHSALKYGARLINAILGSNSTISCCEVLNSLIFGSHEQHHNSSFLCASTLMGQTNMASAATVGSNHNSRSADGEIVADRGFWPGLSVSLKHNSRFAAFTLLAKGAYPAELDISLPFTLVSNDEAAGELHLMPGYWFRYNMYALARNASKAAARDQRQVKHQELEFDWLAPDTVCQMHDARRLLEDWAGEHPAVEGGTYTDGPALLASGDEPEFFSGTSRPVENGRRPARILHAGRGWRDYGRMIRLWCVRELIAEVAWPPAETPSPGYPDRMEGSWLNLGGQQVFSTDLEETKVRIRNGEIQGWDGVHAAYREMAGDYGRRKAELARELLDREREGRSDDELVEEARETADFILAGICESRQKDYTGHFRNITFETDAERDEVLGAFDENSFIREAKEGHRRLMILLAG